jgi:hypothetical protein
LPEGYLLSRGILPNPRGSEWIKIIQVESWWADTRPITACAAITTQSIIISQD